MDKDALQRYFFIGFLLAVSIVVLLIFLPFLEVLVLSTIFGVVLTPVHRKLSDSMGKRDGVAAFLVVILFAFIVIIPSTFLATQILSESKDVYGQLTNHGNTDYIQKVTTAIEGPIQKIYPSFSIDVGDLSAAAADWITSHLSSIFSRVLSIATGIFLIFISLFFFLRDGRKFKATLVELSPLNDKYDEQIFEKLKHAVTATVKGVILVAVVQGFLAGLGLAIFGVPHATLWGSISAVASLVPGLGTAIVFIPAIAYMYFTGSIPHAIGLLLWSTLIVGLVDNFLTPYLYSRSVEIHQLLMLFSVLGSIALFGPILLSLFFALIDIYQSIILKKNSL
jgi:predicted PurR-regulated permease PerM